LRLAQMFQRKFLPRMNFIRKNTSEELDRIAQLLGFQAQPMPLPGAHARKLAALLRELRCQRASLSAL